MEGAPTATAVESPTAEQEAAPAPPSPPQRPVKTERPPAPLERDGEDEPPPRSSATISGSALNIAKLQAMPMPDLNQMAKEMGIENFGTMRKHELIFQVLQKMPSAPASCSPKAFWKSCRKVLVSCARAVSTICPARRIFTFRRRRFAGSICKPAT